MKAIILNKPGEFQLIEKAYPGQPDSNQVLLKIKSLSVCGTDLHAFEGKQPFFIYPRILGHEIAAEVVQVGNKVTHLKPGDLCSVEPYRNAIVDQAVRRGKTTCGSQLTVLGVHEDGGMQEYLLYQADKVHKATGLSLDQIAVIEPFAIGSRAVERATISPKDIVLVAGVGPIGIAVICMARLKGARVIALDINESRLKFAKNKFSNIDCVVLSDHIILDLQDLLKGDLPTVVIDATGNEKSMLKTFEYVAAGGTIVFVGLFQGNIVFNDPYFHKKELTLKATRAAKTEDFKKVIRLFRSGLINIDGYLSHRIKFDMVTQQFTELYLPEENVIKAIIEL